MSIGTGITPDRRGSRAGEEAAYSGQHKRVLGLPLPWFLTAVATLLLCIYTAFPYTFGVFFKPISEQLHWSRGAFSGSYAVRSVFAGLAVVPAGYLADRYGPRWIILPCFALLGIGFIATAAISELWHLYLVQGVVIGIGSSGPWAVLAGTVAKWHDRRRALALGIAAAGSGLSSAVFPPIAAKLILAFDWRWASVAMGLPLLAVSVVCSLYMRNPETPGLSNTGARGANRAEWRGLWRVWCTLPAFLGSSLYFPIFAIFFLFNASGWIVMTHFVNYATDAGVDPLLAAEMVSALGVGSFLGRIGLGLIGDKIGAKRDAVACLSFLTAGTVALLVSGTSQAAMWLAAVLFGLGFGGTVAMAPSLLAQQFGTKHLSTLTGMTSVGTFAAIAIGPWMAGLIFDASGSYTIGFAAAAALGGAAIVCALVLRLSTFEDRARTDALLEGCGPHGKATPAGSSSTASSQSPGACR